MVAKSYYFILSPKEVSDALKEKAANYYGTKNYEYIAESSEFMNTIRDQIENTPTSLDINLDLLLIGVSAIAMAKSDSVYVSKDWENDDYCKICHAMAFSHGLEIVYES